jgi:glycosyltransferase involved in cell wall biosynthesis
MSTYVPTTLVSFDSRDDVREFGTLRRVILGRTHFVGGLEQNPINWRLVSELRAASVVHCHQEHVLSSTIAALYGRATGRPVFVTDHGGGGWDLSAYVDTYGFYSGHLHVSDFSRRVSGQSGRPQSNVVMAGVDSRRFSPEGSLPPSRSNVVVFVGRVLPHKGLENLIDALPRGLQLRIVGPSTDPGYLGSLLSLARGKGVEFAGAVPDHAIVSAYRAARCVVLPSVYRTRSGATTKVPELLGQTLLEGMACGRPVLCTNAGGMPEVVRHGETGFVVDGDVGAIAEALSQLATDDQLVDRLGATAREDVVARFQWETVVERCLAHYRAALGVR